MVDDAARAEHARVIRRRVRALTGIVACAVMTASTAWAGDARSPAPRADAPRSLRLEDYLRWETAGGAQLSPDATLVAYRRTQVDAAADDYVSQLWIIDPRSFETLKLGTASGVHWTPDGRLASWRDAEGGGRLVLRRIERARGLALGPAEEIRIDGPRPSAFTWSRDARSIAFLASVPRTRDPWPITLPAAPAGATWKRPPTIIDGWQYRTGVGQVRTSDRHLFVVPATGGAPRQVTHGAWSVGATYSGVPFGATLQWLPDHARIVFDGNPDAADDATEAQRSYINVVDVASGRLQRLTPTAGFWNLPRVSPDGRWIAYAGYRASSAAFPVRELRVMATDGSDDRLLWEDTPDRVFAMEWEANGRALLVSMNREGRTELVRVPLRGARETLLSEPARFYLTSYANGIAVGSLTAATHDAEVALFDVRRRALRALARPNAVLDEVRLGAVESFWVNSADGTRVQAWLVMPPDFVPGRRYPLLLDAHGGPDAMAGWELDFRHQEFAARGYLVAFANPRGSTGYGAAFANGIDGGFPGERDASDLEAVVAAVVARGIVDTTRIHAMGCSAGGSLVASLVARSDTFSAAASMCAVTDWISMAGTTDATTWAYTRFATPFWTDPAPWLAHSPLLRAGSIHTPLLLAVGAQDGRTPASQSEALYRALRARGVASRLLIFPDEAHGPWRGVPSNLLRLQLYLDEWFRTRGHPGEAAP